MKKAVVVLPLLLAAFFFFIPETKAADTYTDLIYASSTVAGTVDIGRQSGVQDSHAIRYIPQQDQWICKYTIALRNVGAPSWGVYAILRTGGSVPETGTVFETVLIPATSVSSTMSNVTVDLTTCLWRSALSVAWIELQGESSEVAKYYQTNYGSINVNELPTQSWIRRATGATFWSATTTPGGMQGYIYGWNGLTPSAGCTDLADCGLDPNSTPGLIYGLGVTSTSITAECPDFGIFTPICDFVLWLTVPNPISVASQVSSTVTLIKTRFPFSYITNVQEALTTASTQTSSTAISLTLEIPHSTTSSFGNFMPSSTLMFSSSTVYAYGNASTWTILRALMALAVYFATIEMIYFGALGLIRHKND